MQQPTWDGKHTQEVFLVKDADSRPHEKVEQLRSHTNTGKTAGGSLIRMVMKSFGWGQRRAAAAWRYSDVRNFQRVIRGEKPMRFDRFVRGLDHAMPKWRERLSADSVLFREMLRVGGTAFNVAMQPYVTENLWHRIVQDAFVGPECELVEVLM